MEVKMGKHPSNLPVFSLYQYDPQGLSTQPFDIRTLIADPFNFNSFGKFLEDLVGNRSGRLDQVFFVHFRRGVSQPGGEGPIVGKKN
jgi:hypothetical protein